MNILLIDDDEWIRDSLRLFFESENCRIHTVESAEQGLTALDNQHFDLIIADYWLPGMNGLAFFELIRETTSKVIKILITAYGSNQVIEDAVKVGVHCLISKPFTSCTVESVLSQLIESKKSRIPALQTE